MREIVLSIGCIMLGAITLLAWALCRMSARCQRAEWEARIADEALAMRERARMEQRQKVAAV